MAQLRTMTTRVSSATTNIPKMTPNATSAASSGCGRNESSAGKNAMAPARVEVHEGWSVTPLVHTSPMVLVTPPHEQVAQRTAVTSARTNSGGTREVARPAGSTRAAGDPQAAAARATGGPRASGGSHAVARPAADTRPAAARDEVLALLRDGSGRRPRFDPGLSGGLRSWLEDAAAELVARRGEDASPIFLGPRLLWHGSDPTTGSTETSTDPYSTEWMTSCLVRALFRQVVLSGVVDDPLGDALDALRVDPGRIDMARHIDQLSSETRAALAASLRIHVENLMNLTPRFAARWLPRTDDRVAIPLAGGRVVLTGVFDLLVGAPVAGRATLCALGLTTGGRWSQARTALHYLALLETLRSGTPPFRLALLHSSAGRYGVEDVLEEHLRTIVSHVVVCLSTVGRGDA